MDPVAQFSIFYHQHLNADGELTQALPAFAKDISVLQDLYRQMVQLRAYDTKAIALQRTGKMGTYASTLGQEAISVACGHAMHPEDVLAPFYRDYGAQLQRGVKMSEIYRYWGGDERGSAYTDNQHDFPITVPIASQCLHAAGAARAFQLRGEKRVAVATIGDGGTSEGDFYEAMNVAGAWHMPVVFLVNNNQWGISTPRSAQTAAKTIAQKAIAAGFAGEQVDGNDVIALRERISLAIENARDGGGPTLIEALTYRLCDHTTADDATRYRPEEEVKTAWQQEPVKRLQQYLHSQGAWSDEDESALKTECDQNVQTAVDEYLNTEPPELSSIFDFHYAECPADLLEQRAQLLGDA
jgi:2-oxoisovalerate dehydrogenase E1 component subunit alpha